MAVTVGQGRQLHTNEHGLNRIAFAVLPRACNATSGKPGGVKSMERVIRRHIHKSCSLVFGGWKSSKSAVETLRTSTPRQWYTTGGGGFGPPASTATTSSLRARGSRPGLVIGIRR